MRNEALETHYIDHVELVEVIHSVNEDVYPDPKGNPVTVGKLIAPRNATDRDGRNGLDASKAADDLVWSTSSDRLQRASINDMRDYLDVEFEVPDLSKKHAVILRLRNSLFNTVLLYDVMLKGQGVRALDWMGRDLEKLGPRYRLAKWYREQMGMDVSIWNGTGYRALAKIADTGPIAWNEIAIRLPRTSGNTIKLRLSFIADNWHIDQIALAETGAHRSVRKIAVSEVHGANGEVLGAVLENLNHADDDYAIARPADYMRLHFDVGAPPRGRAAHVVTRSGGLLYRVDASGMAGKQGDPRFRTRR
jgi:hypothetical protein